MSALHQKTLINRAETIYKLAKDSKLEPIFFELVAEELQVFQDWLSINREEALLLIILFGLNISKDSYYYINDISDYLDMDPFLFSKYRLCINNLKNKMTLTQDSRERFEVTEPLKKAILENDFTYQLVSNMDSELDALEQFENLYSMLSKGDIDQLCFKSITTEYMNRAQKFNLFKWIKAMELSWREQTFLLTTVWDYIQGDDEFNVKRIIENYLEQISNQIAFINDLSNEKSKLITKNLYESVSKVFQDDLSLKLTDSFIQVLKENNLNVDVFRLKKKNDLALIKSEDIFDKKLYYNDTENEQIEALNSILDKEKLSKIQDKLKSKGLPKGVNILLYGAPGTGKTESVFQLAKLTGRNIFKVDISSTKSAWFGESEKIIKDVFRKYTKLLNSEENTPILLFNEADAIIGKRKEVGSSNVAQTENTIQNIILEELENFEGIFMATTNLVDNMDKAFERRFLYKVKFDNPTEENKVKIWMNKIEFLTEQDAEDLAKNYSFSGGQIDNIVRKINMHEIIENEVPTIEQILNFCDAESWDKNERRKVGF